jgi:hypothetical protein
VLQETKTEKLGKVKLKEFAIYEKSGKIMKVED